MTVESRIELRRPQVLILVALAGLTVLAWAGVAWQSSQMGGMGGLTMGMTAGLFVVTWTVMMAAMMFPSSAPMILMFAQISRGRQARGESFVPTWVFVAAYLLIWVAFGVVAYGAALVVEAIGGGNSWFMANGARMAGGVLIAAGVYQLTPLKHACLAACRSPLGFILTSWRSGYAGAFRMGLEHGLLCAGCCWLLFVILFPLGMANIGILAAVTVFIFAEKVLPWGREISFAAAAVLIGYGVLVVFDPAAFPGMAMNSSPGM
ncbi:MAG TPA: DUF2182 domain-containing protein [Chloroflexota bacterium]|nr:DUF2182 domain-containing protein [Chloroflexota bacterium]